MAGIDGGGDGAGREAVADADELADAGAAEIVGAGGELTRKDGRIHHTWCSELMFTPAEPGQNQRHVDMIWPLWNLFDVTPEGRGTDWYPKLAYGA